MAGLYAGVPPADGTPTPKRSGDQTPDRPTFGTPSARRSPRGERARRAAGIDAGVHARLAVNRGSEEQLKTMVSLFEELVVDRQRRDAAATATARMEMYNAIQSGSVQVTAVRVALLRSTEH
jgi:hypothetical protein